MLGRKTKSSLDCNINHKEIKSFLEMFYLKDILGPNGQIAYLGQEIVGIDQQRKNSVYILNLFE